MINCDWLFTKPLEVLIVFCSDYGIIVVIGNFLCETQLLFCGA